MSRRSWWRLYPAARRALKEQAVARGLPLAAVKQEVESAAEWTAANAGPSLLAEPGRYIRHAARLAALYAGRATPTAPWEVHAPHAAAQAPAAGPSVLEQIIATAEREARLAHIARLGTQERRLVNLLLAGYTLAEAAEQLGVARPTVDTMAHRLRRKAEGTPL